MIEDILKNGIVNWYDFKADSKVLKIEDESDIPNGDEKFDYVIALNSPDYVGKLKSKLNPDGTLLLGFENSLGFKYFCGDKKLDGKRYFSKDQVIRLLDGAGISSCKFYSVLPGLECAQFVFSHDFTPVEDLSIRYLPLYNNPDTVFDFEEQKYNELIKNGLFHSMANSFLVECKLQGEFNDALQVTLSSDRGSEKAYATIIRANDKVEKKILFPEGRSSLAQLKNNLDDLQKVGIKVVENELDRDSLLMPFVNAPLGNVYLQDLAATDKDKFIQAMDCFRDLIYKSAETGKCYFDFVPLNSFFIDGEFVFFDQEFALDLETYTPEMLLYRTLVIVYSEFEKVNSAVPIDFFWDRYNLRDKIQKCEDVAHSFLMTLRKQDELKAFNALHQRNNDLVQFNKTKRNSENFFEPLFQKECFESIAGKKIYVFGSGKFADKFLALYKNDYEICGVVDNNSAKWGQDFRGFAVQNPSVLQNLPTDSCVLICVKDYKSIYLQLKTLNVQNVYLYEAHKIYKGRQSLDIPHQKKYHIGYLSGVFDLYHIGHVNMFRRAKEQCDYLIVGVTSDEYVTNKKKRTPFIPFEERLSVVASCKYVDEAVEVPYLYEGIVEAFEKYHYDVQFCGNDYEHNDWWLGQKAWLEQHGSTIVFFPYTQQTSSTKIKALIDKELEEKNQVQVVVPQPEQAVVQAPEEIPAENIPEKTYKKGFALSSLAHANEESAAQMRALAEQCECFVLGIPSDYVMAKIFGSGRNGYCQTSVKSWWEGFDFINEVVVLDRLDICYQTAYKLINFDVCFYGSEYGTLFQRDKEFFKSKNVSFVSSLPGKRYLHGEGDSLRYALENLDKNTKLILFGTGTYFDIFINNYSLCHEISYALDNNESKWNTEKSGIQIKNPDILWKEKTENCFIVVCAKDYTSVIGQIEKFGSFDYRTMVYANEISLLEEYTCTKLERKKWETLEKVQGINYNLLGHFDSICRKYDVDYYLNFGSLIGALRHQAIIPWDNDVDTVLKRQDWDRLKKHKEEFSGDFFWMGNEILGKKKYFDCLDRICYKNAWIKMDKDYCNYYENYYNSIHLDMFLIDKTFDNFWGRLQRIELAFIYGLMNAYRHKSLFNDYNKQMRRVNRIMCIVGKLFPLNFLKWWADKVARRFDKCENAPYYFISNDVIQKLKMLFPVEIFSKAVDVPFGPLTSKVAFGGDAMCRTLFGDYMQLPPPEMRDPHAGRISFTADSYVFEEPKRGKSVN